MKKKLLLTSILSVIMCFSLICGATFALFTSESTVNIAVTSGTVKVEATIGDLTLSSTLDGVTKAGENGRWTNGGTATVDGGTVTLDKMMPGDTVSFNITVTNHSDVKVKARTIYTAMGELVGGLIIDGFGDAQKSGVTLWRPLEVGSAAEVYSVVITLDENAGNEYQNKSAAITFCVEAVQGNAKTDNLLATDATELADALKAGENVILSDDIKLNNIVEIPEGVTTSIDLNGKTLSGSIIAPNANLTIKNGEFKNGNSDVSAIEVNAGTLVLDDVIISSARHAVRIDGAVTATINGGTYTVVPTSGATQHAVNVSGNATVTINGGEFIGPKGTISDSGAAVSARDGSEVIINGGNFSGGKNNTLSGAGNLTVMGGTFDQDPSAYVATGYQAVENKNGTYTVLPKIEDVTIVASKVAGVYTDTNNTKTYYVVDKTGLMNINTLCAAIEPGEGNVNTINLLADVDLAGVDWEPINTMWVTFNGNGHTISNLTAGLSTDGRRSGFWGYAGGVTINDLTLENVTVSGSQAGIFVGSADGTKINNCYIKGTNTVNFVEGVETWNGIGAVAGVTQKSSVENVTIASDAIININYGTMETVASCKYCDNNAGGTFIQNYSGKVTVETGAQINKTGKVYYPVDINSESAQSNLSSAINSSSTNAPFVLNLGAGEVKLPSASGNVDVTIKGTKDTVIDVTNGAYMDSGKIAFEGVTIKGSTGKANGNGADYAALYCPNVTYTNCTFVGPFRIGRDGATFINCTFTGLGNDYVWTYGNDVTFKGCTFNSDGKAILIYSDGGNEVSKVTVEDCTFNATQGAKAGAIANQNCAAIEIDNYGCGVKLTIENCSYKNTNADSTNGFSGLWRIKSYYTNKSENTITINGVVYTQTALDGTLITVTGSQVQ